MLGEIGFEVIEAREGIDAIQRLRASDPVDVMLVDWNMPEMDGYAFSAMCAAILPTKIFRW
jgi:CheY-like chemotaxis protein